MANSPIILRAPPPTPTLVQWAKPPPPYPPLRSITRHTAASTSSTAK